MKIENLELLVPEAPAPQDSWRWGKIVNMSPLSALLDGDETPILLTDALEAPKLDDRVLILFSGTRAMIVGVAGGEHSQVVRVEDETKEALGDLAEQIDKIDAMSPEDRAKIEQVLVDMADAKEKLRAADETLRDWDEHRLPVLQDELAANRDRIAEAEADLEAAFPTGPFNVGSQIESSATATLTAAALDAQGKATDAANAARVAAEQYAAGEIGEAELRAAQDAEDKAEAARVAAVQAAATDAQSKANAARDAAIQTAATDAQGKATAAANAARQAAIDHANGEISDVELRAAEEAERLAGLAADAALNVAKTHADTAARGAKDAAITAAAADATTKANDAAAAAETAAKAYADGEITDAELRAATVAADKANAARDAAIAAAQTYADTAAGAAETAAVTAAQRYADTKKTEAIDAAALDAKSKADAAQAAAIAAAEEHADLVAQGASQAAIDAAALDAKAKADAAETAAKTHANAQAAAAEQAAKTHATNEAARVKQEALTAAATDAQKKAKVAADAAQQAAEEYALAQAEGLSEQALADAKKDAKTKADAARDAAIASAQTYADARKNEAIDAAALTAQTKADVAKQAAIEAAAADAQAKAAAAASAAETAAKEHADLVAQGASADAIAAAAKDAKSKADAAQAAAIAAAATDAKSKADAAKQAAITAAATDAQTKANKAKTDAITAAATDAQTKANKAKTDAITAAATDAQAKAAAAASAAETAAKAYALAQAQGLSGQALADAKADATAKANAAETAAKNAAAADALSKANAAKQAAIDAAKADLANLQIGGRNLALNSKAGWESTAYRVTGTQKMSEPWIVGETYTVTVKGEVNEGQRFGLWRDSGSTQFGSLTHIGNGIHRITANARETSRANKDEWAIYNVPSAGAESASIEWVKIERGSKATDWSPAPEDVDAGIADVRTIATTADGKATTAVTEAGTAKTNAATAISTANTAKSTADTAKSDAATAKSDASSAKSTASSANTKAGQAVTTANTAKSTADTAKSTADTARSTANTAKSTADTAKSRADSAYQYAADVEDMALNANTTASAAMTTADGKNTVTYTDVTTYPGATPAKNTERAVFDMHRNRASKTFTTSNGITYQSGEILAEWMWSGTSWVPVHMGDGMLRSLDVGKLTAGTGNLQTAVIQKLTATLARLIEVDADKIVTGTIKGSVLDFNTIWAGVANLGRIITKELIANGAVTAEKLNVTYTDSKSGYSFSLQPEGLTITNQDGAPVIVLRADMKNAFGVMDADGKYLASIDQEGNITGVTLSADNELFYKGEPLPTVLSEHPRRNLGRARMSGTNPSVGTTEARLMQCSIRTPPENRLIRITVSLSSNAGNPRRGTIHVRQTAQATVKTTNSSIKRWDFQTQFSESYDYSFVASVDELGWDYDTTITVGVFVSSGVSGENIPYMTSRDQTLTIDDAGPVTELQQSPAYVPSTGGGSGGGGSEADKGKRSYTYNRKASWQQSYYLTTNVKYPLISGGVNVGGKRSYQGYYLSSNGYLKSLIGFPSMTSTLSGATITRVRLRLKNGYAGSSAGVTAVIGFHGNASAPDKWAHSVGDAVRVHHTPGSTRTVDIPSTHWSKIKAGTYKGVSLYIASRSIDYYGWWDGLQTEFIIDYEK